MDVRALQADPWLFRERVMLLTDDGALQHQISHPRHKLPKTYWAQVEGIPDEAALEQLRGGIQLKDGKTAPAAKGEPDQKDRPQNQRHVRPAHGARVTQEL